MHIPVEGDFLSNGERLVEVVARTPRGWRVLDASKPFDDRGEMIPTGDLPRWEHVPLTAGDQVAC